MTFTLRSSFLPGEGSACRLIFRGGKLPGRCPGREASYLPEIGLSSAGKPCASTHEEKAIYGVYWGFCREHRKRWSFGDYDAELPLTEQEQIFRELAGARKTEVGGKEIIDHSGVVYMSGHGWLDYPEGAYQDIDNQDRDFWRATAMYRCRRLLHDLDSAKELGLSLEELLEVAKAALKLGDQKSFEAAEAFITGSKGLSNEEGGH